MSNDMLPFAQKRVAVVSLYRRNALVLRSPANSVDHKTSVLRDGIANRIFHAMLIS